MRFFRYLFRELANNKRFVLLFVLNLSLGLSGFIALEGFKNSLDYTIKGKSKAVLGGDFGISARRPFTKAEIQLVESTIERDFSSTDMIEMFSMVANKDRRSRLVQLKIIDDQYPFYGEILLEKQGVLSPPLHHKLQNQAIVWIYPELLRQLDVQVGETLRIGDQDFLVDDVIVDDAAAGITTSMAPRIYMNIGHLKGTGLLREGSIAWHSKIYKLPDRNSQALDQLRDTIFKIMDSPDIQVYTNENVSEQMTVLVNRLNDFLGLASLVALFLAAVGSAFLFRSYFRQRIKPIAILMTLGASRQQAFSYYVLQIIVLGLVSSLIAALAGLIIVPGLAAATKELLPFPVEFRMDPLPIWLGLMIGTLGSFLICLPLLVSLKDLRPSLLLVAEKEQSMKLQWSAALSVVPFFVMFWGLSVWLSHSYQIGSLFSLLFLVSGFLLGGFALSLFRLLEKIPSPFSLSLKWALRDLSRKPLSTLAGFVAIGLGSLLLNLVPQVQASLQAELARPEDSKLPSLFMFDIQDEQKDLFEEILQREGLKVDFISPMIRARLMSVNDQNFDKGTGKSDQFSREEEREMRFRNRGFNLSYRDELSEAETILEGKPFSGPFSGKEGELAEISVETRFASRLGLKLGDVLEFDVESIPIKGKVINLRSIRWTSFRPNFFVQFQPGVLEMAPKTFVATLPNLPLAQKQNIQDRLVEALPNVSMVDISRIVSRISGIMEQMSWALFVMSILCLLAGFVVIYSIANHQTSSQSWEIGLLKALGASFPVIRGQFFWQYGLLSFSALSLGALLSLVMSYYLSTLLFDSLWVYDGKTPLLTVGFGTVITLIIAFAATRKSLQQQAWELFSESQ